MATQSQLTDNGVPFTADITATLTNDALGEQGIRVHATASYVGL